MGIGEAIARALAKQGTGTLILIPRTSELNTSR